MNRDPPANAGGANKSLAFAFEVGPFAGLDKIGPVITMLFRIALKHFQLHLPERITATQALGEIAVIVGPGRERVALRRAGSGHAGLGATSQ